MAFWAEIVGPIWQSAAMPPRRKVPVKAFERSIHFYRIDTGADDGGRPLPLDVDALLNDLDGRPWQHVTDGGRYVNIQDGDALAAWVDRGGEEPIGDFTPLRLRFDRLRRNAIPQTELGGKLTSVRLSEHGSLSEVSHLLFLPNSLLGVEFNFFGPRASRLPDYLQRIAGSSEPSFAVEQLLRSDVADVLDQQRGLRVFDLQVRPSYAASVADASASLSAALTAARQVGDPTVVGVYLQADPKKRSNTLGRSVLMLARNLARRPDLRDNSSRFKVRSIGPDGQMQTLDLLADQLLTTRKVTALGARSRAVNSESAYAAIRSAYEELNASGHLDAAAGVSMRPA
jgi:hypothetical protein